MNLYDYYITPEEYARAASIGVDNQTLDRRVRLLGWSKQRAISEPIRDQVPRDHYSKWVQIAERNGIKYQSFMSRLRRGWTPERAATHPLQSDDEIKQAALRATEHVRVHPERYLRIAEQNGIPYATFHRRVKVSGWDYDRAATEPIWSAKQRGRLGARRLREREGDWSAQIFGKR